MRDDAGRLCGRDRRVAVAVHGLALEALKRSVPDARGEGDSVQIGKCDLEGVGRDVAEHSVPQGRDLAGVLLDDVAQVDHGGRGLLCDPDGLLREEDGLIGRGLRREGDGLVVFVVLLGGFCQLMRGFYVVENDQEQRIKRVCRARRICI